MSERQTKEEFKSRVREWAQRLDVQVSVISLRIIKHKWASYTTGSGLLIFNAELVDEDKDLSDYVIVHELLHYRAPNHGKLCKTLMRAYLGDYEKLEKRLNQLGGYCRVGAQATRLP